MYNTVLLILACATATYLTRIGGYVIVSRFGKLNHRVAAALDAVPTAVLAALVAPYLVTHSVVETVAIIVSGVVSLRYSLQLGVAAGLIVLVLLRMLS